MEDIKNLLIRFRQSGVLLFIGFLLIIYVAFGFVYFQQSLKQKDLEEQVAKISLIVDKPLASKEQLQEECDKVNDALAPITDSDAIATIVGIAEKSGIDVSPASDNLIVPSAAVREEKVGGGTYQVFSFKNISVQGDYDNVMAFISDLDLGETPEAKTMVLTRITINQIEVTGEGEEATEGEEEVEVGTRIEANATLDVDLYTNFRVMAFDAGSQRRKQPWLRKL